MINALRQELQQEITSTGSLLDRVPKDKLDWNPHLKSLTLGQMALHIALPSVYGPSADENPFG